MSPVKQSTEADHGGGGGGRVVVAGLLQINGMDLRKQIEIKNATGIIKFMKKYIKKYRVSTKTF